MPLASLDGARVEIKEGAAKLREDPRRLERYRREIGLLPKASRPARSSPRLKPGKRGPRRDKVGPE
jgi:hypothetical protein